MLGHPPLQSACLLRVYRADARRCATPLRGRGDSAWAERWHATRRDQFGLLFITPALR